MPDNNDPYEIIATLDEAILRNTEALKNHEVGTDEYDKTLKELKELHNIRRDALPDPTAVLTEKGESKKDRVKFKDFLPMIGSLSGILAIITFEAFGHTLTSKATAFVSKGK